MANPIYLVVSIWIREGRTTEFETYERKAARVMKRYGGAIEHTVRVNRGNTFEHPFEIHVISFPDQEMFGAYQMDAEIRSLASEREAAVVKTVIMQGSHGPGYA
jgi:uncharacterized protein (DUF1330 family)